MGKRLKEREITIDMMITSHAKRAHDTCLAIAKVLGFPKDKIKIDKRLYHAGEEAFLAVLKSIREPNDTLALFSHNPGLTDFANQLFGETIMNIPTTGIVSGTLDIESWSEITTNCGRMDFFDFPKRTIAD